MCSSIFLSVDKDRSDMCQGAMRRACIVFLAVSVLVGNTVCRLAHVRDKRASSLIVGGNDAGRAKYTQFAWIFYKDSFHCGGTILSTRSVVTAAHCLTAPPQHYSVAVGKYKWKNDEGTEQYFNVSRYITHERYAFPDNDIAILRLDGRISYNYFIQPATLAKESKENLENCYAVGAGINVQTSDSYEYPRVLQELQTSFIGRKKCKKRIGLELDLPRSYISTSMLCTLDTDAGVCFGDSGGPVGCFSDDGTFTQVGILSFGSQVCTDGFNVYTRVSKYKKWIKDNA